MKESALAEEGEVTYYGHLRFREESSEIWAERWPKVFSWLKEGQIFAGAHAVAVARTW